MADVDTVKQLLRSIKTTVSESDGGDFVVEYRDVKWHLCGRDVDDYLQSRGQCQRPVPPAVCRRGFFEQAVEIQGKGALAYRGLMADQSPLRLTGNTERVAVLGPATTFFALAQLDTDEIARDLRRLLFGPALVRRVPANDDDLPPFSSALWRIRTIQISVPPADPTAGSCAKLEALADAALFHMAYSRGVGLSRTLAWERPRRNIRGSRKVQFPLRTYMKEILPYYHLAVGTDNPVMEYLALYKILEFFFTSTADQALLSKMTDKLVSPGFVHTSAQELQSLAKIVRSFDARMDERRMLKAVLERYWEPSALRQWIVDYDNENGSYLTVEREVFAEKIRIDVSDDQLFATVANRVYHIRNALVHHKEGEAARFIPFSGQEEVLHRELPLLSYLAEQIIIRTGEDV